MIIEMLEEQIRNKEDIWHRHKSFEESYNDLKGKVIQLEKERDSYLGALATLSHETKNTLGAVLGYADIILEERTAQSIEEFVPRIKSVTDYGISLVNDTSDSVAAASKELKYEPVNLTDIALGFEKQANYDNKVKYDIAEGMVVDGDPVLLKIAILNLLGNADKFTRKAVREHHQIAFGFNEAPDGKSYFVKDNGIGFDMAQYDKLFAEYERLHSQEEVPGTGYGLSNVKTIIERHGGKMWAEGEVGKGAAFFFTLGAKKYG